MIAIPAVNQHAVHVGIGGDIPDHLAAKAPGVGARVFLRVIPNEADRSAELLEQGRVEIRIVQTKSNNAYSFHSGLRFSILQAVCKERAGRGGGQRCARP